MDNRNRYEQLQHIVAMTEAAQDQICRIYLERSQLVASILVRVDALLQAAALAGAPEAVMQQLGEQDMSTGKEYPNE